MRTASSTMAEEILNQVHVSNMFNLRGVVAVVTGGGSVCDNYSMIGLYLMASVQGIGLMISGGRGCGSVPTTGVGQIRRYRVSPDRVHLYPSILVSLMYYASLGTRPDIAFAVARLCQYQSNSSPIHVAAAQRVFRYLRSTAHLRLCLGHSPDKNDSLVGYADADFARDKDNYRA